MKGVYNAKLHPKVKSGEKTEEQVFMEFLQNFGDKDKDGKLTRTVSFIILRTAKES